jgi:hypothetical protein
VKGAGTLKVHQRRGEEQGADLHVNFSEQMLERQEGQKRVGNKPLPEIGQVVVQKVHVLSQ